MHPNPTCHICSHTATFLLNKDGHDLFKCNSCALVFVFPQPTPGVIKNELYSEDSGYQAHKPKDLSRVEETPGFKKVFEYLEKNNVSGKILDVGASNGEFLYAARARGFIPFGVELNPRTARTAIQHNLDVTIGTLDDVRFEENFFDVIYLGDVIEHVIDPRKLLTQCKDILKPGGLLVISTPNLDCLWSKITYILWKMFRIPWSSVTPPYHLFQFSVDNISTLVKDVTLSLEKIWYQGRPRLMYELGSLHLIRKCKKLPQERWWRIPYTVWAFFFYTVTYGFCEILRKLKLVKKDFAMVVVVKKV